jgi:hypothetical protein
MQDYKNACEPFENSLKTTGGVTWDQDIVVMDKDKKDILFSSLYKSYLKIYFLLLRQEYHGDKKYSYNDCLNNIPVGHINFSKYHEIIEQINTMFGL